MKRWELPLRQITLACLISTTAAQAGFDGAFAPDKWTLQTGGVVDLADAPRSLKLMCAPGADSAAEWIASVPAEGMIEFDWQYTPGADANGRHDKAGYRLGQTTVELTSSVSSVDRGHVSVGTGTNGAFAFWIRTEGKSNAPGKLTLRNFRFTAQPVIQQITLTPAGVDLTFVSCPGRIHRVQACSDLSVGNWTDVSPDILAMDARTFYQHGRKAGNMMFYRVVVEPEN